MDLLQMLKQANLFSPTGQMAQQQFPAGLPSSQPVPNGMDPDGNLRYPFQDNSTLQNQGMDLNTAIQGLLNPKDEQFQNFDQMIQAMPQRSNYPEPGFWKKFQAHIAGMGAGNSVNALNVTDQIEHAPYYKALDAWKNQIEPTEKIAQMEQTRNVGNRQTGIGILQREAADKRIEETERKNREAEADRDAERERKIAHDKVIADTRTWIQSHPQYEGRTDKDGKLFYVNKTDPSDIKDSGIDTGKLGDLEKSDLNIKGKLQEIQARGQVATDLEGKKQANRLENEAGRQVNRLELKSTPTGNSGIGKPLTPAASAVDKTNKAIEIINARPELAQYFVVGNNKKPTGQLQFPKDADPQEVEFLNSQMGAKKDISLAPESKIPAEINPKLNVAPSPSNNSRELARPSTETPQLQQARKQLEAGYVLVTRDGGKSFSQIPASNVNRLKPESGWVVVK